MMSLSLPANDNRNVLRSFWLIISLCFAVALSLGAWLVRFPLPWVCGLAGLVAFGSLVFVRETTVRRLYHAWNNRILIPMGNVVSGLILRVCLFVIFSVIGRAGSSLQLKGETSMWKERDPLSTLTGLLPFSERHQSSSPRGWVRTYLKWAVQSGNLWAVSLIPFFCFLKMVSTEQERADRGNIYTLF
jgi:hypothetical protein